MRKSSLALWRRTDRSQLVKLADAITTSQSAEIQTMEGWLRRWKRPMPATDWMVASSTRASRPA
jgi:hypothetical protein